MPGEGTQTSQQINTAHRFPNIQISVPSRLGQDCLELHTFGPSSAPPGVGFWVWVLNGTARVLHCMGEGKPAPRAITVINSSRVTNSHILVWIHFSSVHILRNNFEQSLPKQLGQQCLCHQTEPFWESSNKVVTSTPHPSLTSRGVNQGPELFRYVSHLHVVTTYREDCFSKIWLGRILNIYKIRQNAHPHPVPITQLLQLSAQDRSCFIFIPVCFPHL